MARYQVDCAHYCRVPRHLLAAIQGRLNTPDYSEFAVLNVKHRPETARLFGEQQKKARGAVRRTVPRGKKSAGDYFQEAAGGVA